MRVLHVSCLLVGLSWPSAVSFSPHGALRQTSLRIIQAPSQWSRPTRHDAATRLQACHDKTVAATETQPSLNKALTRTLPGLLAACVFATESNSALAYSPSDYASDAVISAVQSLKESSGNIEQTFKTYESIGTIITEGRGVGGIINYKGVQLDRGFIADEDTSIYNPGLTLLTESEKARLVEAVIQSRKDSLGQGQWSEENQRAYDFLREKLDPLHTTELRGYLSIFPFYTAFVYLAALAVQQFARDLFPVAYLVGVAAIVSPILILVAAGP